MRILLAHNSLYFPSHGGGDKSNRLLMEALAQRGHDVRVVTRVERFGPPDHRRLLEQLEARGVRATTAPDGVVRFERKGVDVHTVALQPNMRTYFSQAIAEFDPDVIITSTDDPGQLLFDVAIRAPRARVVHLVRATIAVPFGPDSSAPNPVKTQLLRHADAVVGVSHYVARYVREHGHIPAVHVPISLLDPVAEYPLLGHPENRFVSMTNPCAVKGISIFLAIADRMPHLEFAAVPTWGTTPTDLEALQQRPNVTLLPAVDNIDDLLRMTRVMLVPSVWAEARSRIVVEAMSRGIPVISSNAGGLPEAHLGVEYMIPVNLITRYHPGLDRNMVPVADVPPQEIEPWVTALDRLTSDHAHWDDVSTRSRAAALEYARELDVQPFENLINELLTKPRNDRPDQALSDEKRKLLALRLKQKAASAKPATDPWFSGLQDVQPANPVLVCMPYAGGGTLTYRGWKESIPNIVAVRLPGRESRLKEAPFESMEQLIPGLGRALEPHIRKWKFALFGHSMGAGIAFELARWLRRQDLPLPSKLIVSSARAPHARVQASSAHEVTDDELVEQLRRLEGISADVLNNPELLKLALPVLRADTRLYRYYRYEPGDPLPMDLYAYGGMADPNLAGPDLERWRQLTTGEFRLRLFPGGHFYFQTATQEFLSQLATDLTQA